jgi:2-oxo-4-hydroxy-4-carboxy--5-ureidoimidazoline (OHCU) decarboxylase
MVSLFTDQSELFQLNFFIYFDTKKNLMIFEDVLNRMNNHADTELYQVTGTRNHAKINRVDDK